MQNSFRSRSPRITPEGAALPSWLFPLLGNVERAASTLSRDSEAQRFLVKYLGILSQPLTTPELRYVVVTHIHELIAVVLGDASTKANMFRVPEARLRAIKAYILENLRNPELSETAVALRQGVTSRYIRKLFELENTTFSKFVLSHRLMHAHRMLSDSLLTAMNISAIALEVGFSDLSYFDRTFRRQFHATPSEVRQSRYEQSSPHHRVSSQRARPFSAPERGRKADSHPCNPSSF
jgi:AraC-like DNA-binding protein